MSQQYNWPAIIVTPAVGGATAANQTTQIGLETTIRNDLDDLNARLPGGLVPAEFDEIDLTYIVSGNGIGQVGTAIYKLASSTVATLTLTYDSSDRLISTVKS